MERVGLEMKCFGCNSSLVRDVETRPALNPIERLQYYQVKSGRNWG